MMTKELEEEKSLRELLLALNEGLTVYRGLNKNYVPIKVSFSQCAYMTATTAIEELQAYIADLDRDVCREPLCLDLDEMGSEDYWMEKLSKLRSDMVELEEVPLLQRKLIWGYLGFYPWTTTEFYMGVEEQINAIFYLDKMLELIHAELDYTRGQALGSAASLVEERCVNCVIEDHIRECIALLMAERYGDEPLFNIQGHWQAVYRILVDKGYCRDSDFDGFDAFIQRVMPDKVNKPYKKDSVKQISKTDFALPFERWHYDPQISTTRKPYDRMVTIATRFKQILEENGL